MNSGLFDPFLTIPCTMALVCMHPGTVVKQSWWSYSNVSVPFIHGKAGCHHSNISILLPSTYHMNYRKALLNSYNKYVSYHWEPNHRWLFNRAEPRYLTSGALEPRKELSSSKISLIKDTLLCLCIRLIRNKWEFYGRISRGHAPECEIILELEENETLYKLIWNPGTLAYLHQGCGPIMQYVFEQQTTFIVIWYRNRCRRCSVVTVESKVSLQSSCSAHQCLYWNSSYYSHLPRRYIERQRHYRRMPV